MTIRDTKLKTMRLFRFSGKSKQRSSKALVGEKKITEIIVNDDSSSKHDNNNDDKTIDSVKETAPPVISEMEISTRSPAKPGKATRTSLMLSSSMKNTSTLSLTRPTKTNEKAPTTANDISGTTALDKEWLGLVNEKKSKEKEPVAPSHSKRGDGKQMNRGSEKSVSKLTPNKKKALVISTCWFSLGVLVYLLMGKFWLKMTAINWLTMVFNPGSLFVFVFAGVEIIACLWVGSWAFAKGETEHSRTLAGI